MTSIRKKLLVSILSVVALITILLAIATYFSIRHEMDELYDENMEQLATVLADTALNNKTLKVNNGLYDDKLNGEEEFLIQIWRNKALVYSSHPSIDFPFHADDGHGSTIFRNQRWIFYRLDHDGYAIQISQDLHQRHEVIKEIYRVLLVPILIQLPVLAGLIWLLVGYGLRPLTRISNLIHERTASYLEPLPTDDIPVEINTLVLALNDLLTRLKLALEVQRRFTADAAHELRTPLTAVRLQLDILQRAADAQEKKEALDTLERGVARSIRLVEQLLELARQEPDTIDILLTPVDLNNMLHDVLEQAMPFSKAKNIHLTYNISDNLVMKANTAQLSVMIGNLLNNAINYTPENGHVNITARKDHARILLDIADDGIGIKPEDQKRIFDRFYRAAGTEASGSGLGLSIVRSIANTHNIQIELLPGLNGSGTTFRLIIPALN